MKKTEYSLGDSAGKVVQSNEEKLKSPKIRISFAVFQDYLSRQQSIKFTIWLKVIWRKTIGHLA